MKADGLCPRRILDFPCGHGRAMRFIRAAFPDTELYAGETDKSGLAFCASQFNAIPFESNVDLRTVQFPAKFDLIFVGSLATHLPLDKLIALFDVLIDALEDDGVLALSVIGRMYTRVVHDHKYKIIDDAQWPDLVRGFDYIALSLPSSA
jgi:trans-aconitate methyltransferase